MVLRWKKEFEGDGWVGESFGLIFGGWGVGAEEGRVKIRGILTFFIIVIFCNVCERLFPSISSVALLGKFFEVVLVYVILSFVSSEFFFILLSSWLFCSACLPL